MVFVREIVQKSWCCKRCLMQAEVESPALNPVFKL